MPALVLSPPAAPARLEDFSGLPPAYSFVGDGEPFYAETVHYFERLRAAGVPAQLDVYHCDMHAFDMMRPQDAAQRRGGGDIQQTVRLCAGALFHAAAGSGRWRGESTMIFYFSATGNCRYVAERAAAGDGRAVRLHHGVHAGGGACIYATGRGDGGHRFARLLLGACRAS